MLDTASCPQCLRLLIGTEIKLGYPAVPVKVRRCMGYACRMQSPLPPQVFRWLDSLIGLSRMEFVTAHIASNLLGRTLSDQRGSDMCDNQYLVQPMYGVTII